MAMKKLELMSSCEIVLMMEDRAYEMALALNLPKDWIYGIYAGKYSQTKLFSESLVVHNPSLRLEKIFDETTAAIGEDWMWSGHGTYFFVRESDVFWFRLRWI